MSASLFCCELFMFESFVELGEADLSCSTVC
jgi:hypothetical protein